jgi:hypothetical protein
LGERSTEFLVITDRISWCLKRIETVSKPGGYQKFATTVNCNSRLQHTHGALHEAVQRQTLPTRAFFTAAVSLFHGALANPTPFTPTTEVLLFPACILTALTNALQQYVLQNFSSKSKLLI